MNYENFNSCDNLGDTLEYVELSEVGTAKIEDLDLMLLVNSLNLIKGEGSNNIKKEIKALGLKVTTSKMPGVGVCGLYITVTGDESKTTEVENILKSYCTYLNHTKKTAYGTFKHLTLKWNGVFISQFNEYSYD